MAEPAQELMRVTADQQVLLNPATMLQQALLKGAPVEVVDRMMSLYERWKANEALAAFNNAMADAKIELPVLSKNRQVGFDSKKVGAARTSYKHADLAGIVNVVAPILAKHGLSHRFRTKNEVNEPIVVTCVISHRDGHSEENTLRAGRDDSGNKNFIQAIGSTVTYLSRYTLMASLGLAAADDDDGQQSPHDVTPITEAQQKDLLDKLEKAGLKLPRFLQRFELERIGELQTYRLTEAQAAIDAYAAQRRDAP